MSTMNKAAFQKLLEESLILFVNENYSEDKREKILSLYRNPNLPSLLNYSHIHRGSGIYIDESNSDNRRVKIEEDKIKKELEQYRKEIELEINGIDNDDVEESHKKSPDIDKYRHHRISPKSVNYKILNSSTKNMKLYDDTTIHNTTFSDTHDNAGSLKDEVLECRDCGTKFTFTVGEQEFYASKCFDSKPRRCKSCKDEKKSHMDMDGNTTGGLDVDGGKRGGNSFKDRGGSGKTQSVCYFFLQGECKRGNSCHYSHERGINSTSENRKVKHSTYKKSSS